MSRWLIMAVFFAVFLALAAGLHVYLYRRLVRDPMVSEAWKRRGKLAFIIGFICLVGGIPLLRILPETPSRIIGLVCFSWMGTIGIIVPILLATEAPRWLWSRRPHVDEGRRKALFRGVAAVATVSTSTVAVAGVNRALSLPTIRPVKVHLENVPDGLRGLRVVQLSDIHFGPTIGHEFAVSLVQRVNKLKPDIVAITGDLVDGSVEKLGGIVSNLSQIKSRYGTYFVTGNHEYYSGVEPWIEALTNWGIRVLRNEHVSLTHNGVSFDLIGVDDWRGRRFSSTHGHDLDGAVKGRDPSRPGILLAHQPKAIHDAAKAQIDLVLCGHTHGGQIWPFKYVVALVQPYVSGLHKHSDRTWIYVHPGTGYWGPPMRVGTMGEIAVVTVA